MKDTVECPGCDTTQPVTEFAIDKNRQSGLRKFCKTCDRHPDMSRNFRRRYCTIEMPDGTIEDWVIHQKNDRRRYLNKGGVIRAHWFQERPSDQWPTRKELLSGKYPKSNGQLTEPNRQAALPKSTYRHKRPTKKFDVPLPKWTSVTKTESLKETATRYRLRRNKWVDHETCEYTGYGPIKDLEFCHTLAFATCTKVYDRSDWAADENNGFLLLACLNGPMKRGFHWAMDGQNAVYVPPEGEDYSEWMKVLGIPAFRLEPTPAQLEYILMAAGYRTRIEY